MICCTLLAAIFGVLCWVKARIKLSEPARPLEWRPIDGPATAPSPAKFRTRLKSVSDAAHGIASMIKCEPNARIHLVATIIVIAAGMVVRIDTADWRWLIAAMAAVWCAEAINTAIEHICDLVSPGYNELVRTAKDVAAGAVLVTALGAALIGILTFMPYLESLRRGLPLILPMCGV